MTFAMLLTVAQLCAASIAHVPLRSAQSVPRAPPSMALAMIGVGSATVVTSALVGLFDFLPASAALNTICPAHHCNETVHPFFDRIESVGLAANLAAAIGAVYVVGGIAWWLADRFDPPANVRIAPSVSANGAALIAAGSF